MRQVKISRWSAGAVVCLLALVAGCAPSATVALKFSPKDSTTYRVITETERSIKWEGSVPKEPTFEGGRTYDRREWTFTQEIQSVDDKGNAVAKITVKGLKYSSIVKDRPDFEFDSSKPKDPHHPLAMLIGQSYTIKIAPSGEVIEVIDTKEAEKAARKGSVPPRVALRMLHGETIKERHGTLLLPDTDKNQLHIGDNWSVAKTFSFGMLGSESYEKIYTLNKIKDRDNRKVAIVEMNAIPASETAKGQTAFDFSENFDNTKTYTGELELDLTAGKIKEYLENLQSEWIVALPSAEQGANKEPAVLTMTDTRLYHLEKID
jgi:hypothetical protein